MGYYQGLSGTETRKITTDALSIQWTDNKFFTLALGPV